MCVRATVTSFITRCLGEGVQAQVVVVVGCRCWFRRPPLALSGPHVNRPRPLSIHLIPGSGHLTPGSRHLTPGAALEIRGGAGGGGGAQVQKATPCPLRPASRSQGGILN